MIHRDEIGFKILTPIVKTYFKLFYKPTVYGAENNQHKKSCNTF